MKVLRLVLTNLAVVFVVTIAVGASAPRWPGRWLLRDRGPLRLTRLDAVPTYRRFGVHTWARLFPEGGGVFGDSKRTLPGRSREALAGYLLEVRRAEWVHWLSLLSLAPLVAFNPWWLWLLFAVIAGAVNVPFLAILRYNRLRLVRVLARMRGPRG